MDIRRLELLREFADRGSVTAVAAATHRTASAVSQQLKILEREAGVPLTERSGRGIVLTSAGRALARTATEVATAIERAEALWEEFRAQPRGEVSLVIFPTGGQMLLPGLLTTVDGMPGLTLHAGDLDSTVGDIADLTADYDVVVADSPGVLPGWAERGLAVVPLMREPLDIALPEGHPLGARASLSPADLADQTWIGTPAGLPFDRILRGIEAANGTPAHIAQRFADNGIVETIPGLRVVGSPVGPLLAVATDATAPADQQVDPHHWADQARAHGWHLQLQPGLMQSDGTILPHTTHLTITPVTESVLPELSAALVASADEVRGVPGVDPAEVLAALPPGLADAPLDAEGALAVLGAIGLVSDAGGLPDRMAPLLALVQALPAPLTERLLTELVARTFE